MRLPVVALVAFVVAAACTEDVGVVGPAASAGTSTTVVVSDTGSVEPSSSTSVLVTTSTSTSSTIPFSSDLVTVRVPFDEKTFGDAVMSSVAASGVGFVAVGVSVDGLQGDGLVWVSSDGYTWSRVSQGQQVFGGANLNSITAYGDGLVVVGTEHSETDIDAGVWWSDDGLNWVRAPHDETIFGGDGNQFMVSVASIAGGLVAVGESFNPSEGSDAAVWISADGTEWDRVAPQGSVFDDSIMIDVTAFGDLLVAVGVTFSDRDGDAGVWTSTDGTNWTRITQDPTIFGGDGDQMMTSVASSHGLLVAVGFDQVGRGDAAVWTSTDALTWTRIPHDESVFGGGEDGGAEMTSVEIYGHGFVAGGLQQSAGDMDAVVWTSPDGLAWERIITDPEIFGGRDAQKIIALAVGGKTVVAVGLVGPSGVHLNTDPDGVVWTLSP